jgi:hypothetical protein
MNDHVLERKESVKSAISFSYECRVSTRDGRQDTEDQLRQLRAFAGTQGWTMVHEYVDRVSVKEALINS